MQLQLAIDAPEHLALIGPLAPYFDIVEVGTPVLKRFGLAAISTARELAPECAVLADTKTADGGALEAEMMFGAGASLMTVLAEAAPATQRAVQTVAVRHGAEVIFDTILDGDVDVSALAPTYPDAAVWVGVHRPSDARLAGETSADAHLVSCTRHRDAGRKVCMAGGLAAATFAEVLRAAPDIAVIGSSVTGADDPSAAARELRAIVDAHAGDGSGVSA